MGRHWYRTQELKDRIIREYDAAPRGQKAIVLAKYEVWKSSISEWKRGGR